MKQEYRDIRIRLGEPLWYDENGVPRYDPFEPSMCSDIYAKEVALLEIACQGCFKHFRVALSVFPYDARGASVPSLKSRIQEGVIHYGDPPFHKLDMHSIGTPVMCPGATMNCIDLAVCEYWFRDKSTNGQWTRDRKLEVLFDEE